MRKLEFEQVQNKKYYIQIIDQVRRMISEGVLKAGDRLPPERELAAQFGTSRASIREALSALEQLSPDLIVVDYDDRELNRDEFLARFVEGEQKLRVVLLSLQSTGEAIVYDRRTMSALQIDNWLDEWKYAEESD